MLLLHSFDHHRDEAGVSHRLGTVPVGLDDLRDDWFDLLRDQPVLLALIPEAGSLEPPKPHRPQFHNLFEHIADIRGLREVAPVGVEIQDVGPDQPIDVELIILRLHADADLALGRNADQRIALVDVFFVVEAPVLAALAEEEALGRVRHEDCLLRADSRGQVVLRASGIEVDDGEDRVLLVLGVEDELPFAAVSHVEHSRRLIRTDADADQAAGVGLNDHQ